MDKETIIFTDAEAEFLKKLAKAGVILQYILIPVLMTTAAIISSIDQIKDFLK